MEFNTNKIYTYKKGDELYTPVKAIKPLIKYIPEGSVIWECADTVNSDSNIHQVAHDNNISTYGTSIHKGIDFLKCEKLPSDEITHIVTNPPYSLKNEFLQKCYDFNLPFALLLPIQTLDTNTRWKMFSKYGIEIMVYNRRVKYIGSNGSPPFASAWFCKGILPNQIVFENLEL